MSSITVLSLLADGEYRSGQELADSMGISRTAVWKQLRKFAEMGLHIEASRSKGYRIRGGLDLLESELIRGALSATARPLLAELLLEPVLDSTNAELLRRLESGCASGTVCSAEQQTAGRGRRGRRWVSPFAGNLYLSVAWEFTGGAGVLEGLSLAVGVAAVEALERCGVTGLQLKWPNDILFDGAKLGGILIEMVGDAVGSCQVVVGVGINVSMPTDQAREIDQSWTDVSRVMGGSPGRSRLLAEILNGLLPLLAAFESAGFRAWQKKWQQRDAFAGAAVLVTSGDKRLAGTVEGVDAGGTLRLRVGDTVQTIRGGEVSLRPVD